MTDKIPTPLQSEDSVRILPPDFSLKRKIGMDIKLSEIFTPERIAAAQEAIDETRSEFVEWAQRDLMELEHAYRAIQRNETDNKLLKADKIRKLAFSLKCQSGTFGFDLGSSVAKSLYDFFNKHQALDADEMLVLRKHLDALQVIFQQNIQGDGADIGQELMATLDKLTAKFNV